MLKFFVNRKKEEEKTTTFICKCGNKRISNFYFGKDEKHFINCPKCKEVTKMQK